MKASTPDKKVTPIQQENYSWLVGTYLTAEPYFKIHGRHSQVLEAMRKEGHSEKPWIQRVSGDAALVSQKLPARFMSREDHQDPEISAVFTKHSGRS